LCIDEGWQATSPKCNCQETEEGKPSPSPELGRRTQSLLYNPTSKPELTYLDCLTRHKGKTNLDATEGIISKLNKVYPLSYIVACI